MTILDAILLGIIQGLTEFLPISSSGHLVLAEHWLGVQPGDLSFEVAVHVGTLIAVGVFFRKQLWSLIKSAIGQTEDVERLRMDRRLIMLLIIGTLPAVVIGLAFKSPIERIFSHPLAAAVALMVTGVWLLLMRAFTRRDRPLAPSNSFLIGIAQSVAILPGISRSGSTIATGVMLGVSPSVAAEFSFLLSVPAVLGASVLALPEAFTFGRFGLGHVVGALCAAVVGYLAIRWVFAALRRGSFHWFGIYCLVLGAVATVLLW